MQETQRGYIVRVIFTINGHTRRPFRYLLTQEGNAIFLKALKLSYFARDDKTLSMIINIYQLKLKLFSDTKFSLQISQD